MIGRNRTAPSAGHLFGWYTLQRPLTSQVHLVWPPLHLVLATAAPCFGHRCTLFWPPPVRLFAQPTDAREASPQHPAGDVDAYAHTHAHADQLWGAQYENAVPVPRVMWQGRTDLTEISGTGMNVHNSRKCFVRVLMLCRTHISSGYR